MFDLYTIFWILSLHWLGDFVFQTHQQAINKSKSNYYLFMHCMSYSLVLPFIAFLGSLNHNAILVFWFANTILHFCTDYVTSRINSYLWAKNRIHDFFVSIGFDQFVHYICLFGTIVLFRNCL